MDLTLIQGAISGLKTASDIAKGMMDLKSIADVQTRVIDLQSAILNAQSAALSANADQAAMADDIRALKDEIERLKRWEIERTRYRLMKPFEGAVAYGLRESKRDGDPAHWLCTNCFEGSRKVILNLKENSKGWSMLACPVCKGELQSPWRGPIEPTYAEG
jgi:hypothetical protein